MTPLVSVQFVEGLYFVPDLDVQALTPAELQAWLQASWRAVFRSGRPANDAKPRASDRSR